MKSLKILGIFLFIIATITAGYFVYSHFKNSSVQGVAVTESSWAYRRSIFIPNEESIILEKEVTLDIDTAVLVSEGKLQNDCDDIRFQESESMRSLDFQIMSGCNTADTKIKIWIPSLPIGGENIYMFYGNPKALPISISVDNT